MSRTGDALKILADRASSRAPLTVGGENPGGRREMEALFCVDRCLGVYELPLNHPPVLITK